MVLSIIVGIDCTGMLLSRHWLNVLGVTIPFIKALTAVEPLPELTQFAGLSTLHPKVNFKAYLTNKTIRKLHLFLFFDS